VDIVVRTGVDIVPMNSKKKVTISWSGGKDSAFALYKILSGQEYKVVSLHTVIDEDSKRVGLHGVREKLIDEQAKQIGLPLEKIYLLASGNQQNYESLMKEHYLKSVRQGVEGIIFGDIFLEDLKHYRLELLKPSGLFAVFPLWQIESHLIVTDFINVGFKTIICAADSKFFSRHNVGKSIDGDFLIGLPPEIDPCGENGEFHSFVYDGPIFKMGYVLL
jgi:uncharacterized protein (TIGR00290 family)